MAYEDGLDAINGDTIYDLDIGQNSLSFASDRGESIYFKSGLIDQAATQISVSGDSEFGYEADITLYDNYGYSVEFDLYNLNGPTTALYGDQTYQLVAVWEDVSMDANFKDVGVGSHYDAMNETVTGLRFEWQGLGEKVGTSAVDMLTGSNGSNTFQAYGGDDVLNGAGGGDTYQFTGDFGNDKVLDFGHSGTDILQIGASVENVWLERMGRRGDELKISVNDGTNVGTISVGRQFNPYTTIASVEEIHFGFNGTTSEDTMSIATGMYGGDIKVLKDGAEEFHVHGDDDTTIYMNANEGSATVSLAYRGSDSWMGQDIIGLDIDYGTHEDTLEVEINTNDGSYNSEDVGAMHSLLSKNGISVDTTGGELHGISVSQNSDGAYTFTDIETSTLLFALETIDANSYGA